MRRRRDGGSGRGGMRPPAPPRGGGGPVRPARGAGERERPVELRLKVLLTRTETSPEDVHGMLHAKGILTARGGATAHAAVVARGLGIPCVVGCEALRVDYEAATFPRGGKAFAQGADGSTAGS